MASPPTPKIEIVDHFLPQALNQRILRFAIDREADFVPSTVEGEVTKTNLRHSMRFDENLNELEEEFGNHMDEAIGQILESLGVPAFEPDSYEVELVAHGDGAFYKPHIDTFTRQQRSEVTSDRVVSCVYYLHSKPKGFDGGKLALFQIGKNTPFSSIEPVNNRLIAFPSFVMHEVEAISCPSGKFDKSRFAINCWVHRKI